MHRNISVDVCKNSVLKVVFPESKPNSKQVKGKLYLTIKSTSIMRSVYVVREVINSFLYVEIVFIILK